MSDSQTESKPRITYALRVREKDGDPWGEPDYYHSRKKRDDDASSLRIFGGLRTWSYQERKRPEEIEYVDD